MIERERERLEELETENCNLEQMLESCPLEEQQELQTKYQRNKELLYNQRKLFDDLEFQQLEVINKDNLVELVFRLPGKLLPHQKSLHTFYISL